MAAWTWRAALSTLTILGVSGIAGQAVAQQAGAKPEEQCAVTAQDAVKVLPMPLAKWGRVVCTPLGHMLASHDGWLWLMPDELKPVLVPSAFENAEDAKGDTYFSKIEIAPATKDEFTSAYEVFHEGFDDNEEKPDGYRVDLTSSTGAHLRMFFFDYDTYAWGMACPKNACAGETRFMILDMATKPVPRGEAKRLARANSI